MSATASIRTGFPPAMMLFPLFFRAIRSASRYRRQRADRASGLRPTSLETDDAIVASIVRVATGRTMAVVFDHRAAPEPPVMSWRPDATV